LGGDGGGPDGDEDFLEHVQNLEQDLELLREQQERGHNFADIEINNNNELLESENKELYEKLAVLMDENHKIKEDNDIGKKTIGKLEEETKNLNTKLETSEKMLRKTMQSEEKKKDSDYELMKIKKD
jgi:hypothetical protein